MALAQRHVQRKPFRAPVRIMGLGAVTDACV